MFTVQPVCKTVLLLIWLLIILLINIYSTDIFIAVPSVVLFVWQWVHLSRLKIKIDSGHIVKQSGRFFQRKTIIMLKNISHIQIYTLHPLLPAVIRLHIYGGNLLIIGLDGRQAESLVKAATIE